MEKTTLTMDKRLRDDIMFIKIACKAKSAEVVVKDAIKLLRFKLKEELNSPEQGADAFNGEDDE